MLELMSDGGFEAVEREDRIVLVIDVEIEEGRFLRARSEEG